ncbi:hypothetical protein C6P40_004808 [Pichia californica]|uniref:Uncharacterized protein n=1 Tax=Pichia californica TaxID=460514 RepID=A0A9P6WNZ3_9ASCO|nr:hypothetical protein C6P42_004234 [[Candida] californica]KAG0689602.1 hypothetical protein C6P40_004808 [[Candida] californica]
MSNVKKICIVGSGPSGLVALNEYLHTSVNGESMINSFDSKNIQLPEKCAFDEIVVFEQTNSYGGVWNYSEKTDPDFPNVKDYSKPKSVRPSLESPTEEELKNSSKDQPFIRQISSIAAKDDNLWTRSAVYDDLFTNIPYRVMRFSAGFDIDYVNTEKENNIFYPFVKHEQVMDYIDKYVKRFDLKKYVRFNTSVEKVYKKGDKWVVVVVQFDRNNGIEKWYSETFDAMLLAVGRFNIPFIPAIENLTKFRNKHPGIISHTKSFRNFNNWDNEKVLLVGSSISAVDLLQYLIPKSKNIYLSSNDSKISKVIDKSPVNWMQEVLADDNVKFHRVPRIKRFTENGVEFEDGTIINDFDKILFATGYHLSYPFLNIPENEGKEYIKISSGRADQSNFAQTTVDNVYLYGFTVGEPTLGHIGIPQNPLFFLTSEANAIAQAGVWSGCKTLPSIQEQRKWCENRLKGKVSGFQMFNENTIKLFYDELYKYAPANRFDLQLLLRTNEIVEAKAILKDLFHKFSEGELN